MDPFLTIGAILMTSASAYFLFRKSAQVSVLQALGKFLDFAGTLLVFVLLNTVALGVLLFALRGFGIVISLYRLDDPMLVILSAVQTVIYELWQQKK